MLRTAPVTPDAETAREWAREELAKPIYSQGESWADRLARWISDFLEDVFSGTAGPGIPVIGLAIALVVVILVVAVLIAVVRPILQDRRRRASTVLEDDERSAAAMRSAAQHAAKDNDWTTAAMERFRAIVAGMEERGIIDEQRGRTAYEAARDGGAALPACASDLHTASDAFDQICYGHREATVEDYEVLTTVDDRVRQATPQLHGTPS